MHREPPRRERYRAAFATIAATIGLILIAVFGSATPATGATRVGGHPAQLLAASQPVVAPAAAPPGCNLSEHWRVTFSAKWGGTRFRYGVINSPGPLRVVGPPNGSTSMFFTFKSGGERSLTGVYARDLSKPGYVYRTLIEGGPDTVAGVVNVVQLAMADSGAWCQRTIDRP